jgi:hypothetical protein
MDSLDTGKLAGADLLAFVDAADGIRTVLVELDQPAPRSAPPVLHRSDRSRSGITVCPQELDENGVDDRMAALERELTSICHPLEPVRLDLARAFAVTVTPIMLRAIIRLRHVGIVRPRRTETTCALCSVSGVG